MNEQSSRDIDPAIQSSRKKQIWLIVLVMTSSACVGVLILLGILWLLRDYLAYI